jgi:hypothetical protein
VLEPVPSPEKNISSAKGSSSAALPGAKTGGTMAMSALESAAAVEA